MTGAGKRARRTPAASPAPIDATAAPIVAASTGKDFPPPPWLTEATALDVWNRIAPELRRFNMLTAADSDTFARYCWHFAGFIRCIEQAPIGREYVDVKMTNSEERMPRLHPAVKAREVHERHLIDIEDRFGGSPLARYRLIAQQAAHPGAFGDLFSSKASLPGAAQPGMAAEPPPPSPVGILRQPTAH